MLRSGHPQPSAYYHRVTLNNGIRVVSERMPAVRSVSLGVWVNVGSRDEQEREQGVAHFIEHMLFKGTSRRSADAISREIDQLGGELNAFTSRETTTFYFKVIDHDLTKAISLLADIFRHSTFAPREVAKEKQVILEEIRMVEDDPEDYVHDLHTFSALKPDPLGRPILGNTKTVADLRRSNLISFRSQHYRPENIVIAVAGKFELQPLIGALSKTFGKIETTAHPTNHRSQPHIEPGLMVRTKRLTQTHLCLGTKGLRRDHPDQYALALLNSMLGGSVSSRLFREIREKRGLAYSIYSSLSSFEDIGLLTIYAATRQSETLRVMSLIMKELNKFHAGAFEVGELKRAKGQLKGSLLLGLESTGSRMAKLAKDEMDYGRPVSVKEIMSEIDRVRTHHIRRLSHDLVDTKFQTVTTLGPLARKHLQSVLSTN